MAKEKLLNSTDENCGGLLFSQTDIPALGQVDAVCGRNEWSDRAHRNHPVALFSHLSKYRLVVKTALKLLLVFVEYSDSNSQLLMNTVRLVDSKKTLNGILTRTHTTTSWTTWKSRGWRSHQYYMSKQGTDLDLLQQFQIYEAVLKHEDGVPDTKPLPLDARFRQIPRSRKSLSDDNDRRKSRRHSVGTVSNGDAPKPLKFHSRSLENTPEELPYNWQDRNQNHIEPKKNHQMNGHMKMAMACLNPMVWATSSTASPPSLRRRREQDARNKSLIKEQEENSRAFHRSDSLSSSQSALGRATSQGGLQNRPVSSPYVPL
ncbi:hypothetical protein CEXT_227421 [Caerostris extrusa]|uniref:FHOD1/3-like FH3 domain-containing protein n=1 Tax=Caerostris extrusa TaxID=172846 RepID=A0AAV4NTC1_CAEEX|nr:hypothetical protein CEXT_227421 [Caerostris extrusa]